MQHTSRPIFNEVTLTKDILKAKKPRTLLSQAYELMLIDEEFQEKERYVSTIN